MSDAWIQIKPKKAPVKKCKPTIHQEYAISVSFTTELTKNILYDVRPQATYVIYAVILRTLILK